MEFAMGLTFSVPKYRREMDPDAEHTALMHDMEYIIEADKRGFKYGLVAEHHFLDEYSHTSANHAELGPRSRHQAHSSDVGDFQPASAGEPSGEGCRAGHLTEGRFEFGTGRGAGSYEILGFLPGVTDMSETRNIWEDVIGESPKMWMQEVYEGQLKVLVIAPASGAAEAVEKRSSSDVVCGREHVELDHRGEERDGRNWLLDRHDRHCREGG